MIYRFDEFELDTDKFELRRDGKVRHVEPLVFDLMVTLSQNAGRVISRDEIIELVWNGRLVSDATISSCVKSARKALGDTGETQSYIQTVRGRGFRFVADVSAGDGPPAPKGADGQTTVAEPSPAEGGSSPAADPPPVTDRPVVAVLPFDNLSAEGDSYFADGLTEDIITNLTRFRELAVIARTSTFRFRDSDAGIAGIAAALNAGYVVEGSVRRAGGRVRITAQLIDAQSGVHLWADKYDRDLEDIFAVQDELARTIAATLGVKMQDVALQRALKKSPAELDAYDHVLRARRYTVWMDETMHAEARDLLEKAVALDPSSADAHALLANVYLAEHRIDANPLPNSVERALAMAEKAVALDPQNGYARSWLAITHYFRFENDLFEAEAERALDLNPNDPEVLADIGHYRAFRGEFERGIELSRRALALNPLHPGWYLFSFARYHYDRREYDQVLALTERIGMTGFYWRYLLQAAAEGQIGHPNASASLARMYENKPGLAAIEHLKKWNTAADDLAHLTEGLKKAGLKE